MYLFGLAILACLGIARASIQDPVCMVLDVVRQDMIMKTIDYPSHLHVAIMRFSNISDIKKTMESPGFHRMSRVSPVTVRYSRREQIHWHCGYPTRDSIRVCDFYIPYSNKEERELAQSIRKNLIFPCPYNTGDDLTHRYFYDKIVNRVGNSSMYLFSE